jgi:hypothetical protein
VGKATGVQDDEVDPVGGRFLYAVNEFMFGIALETAQFVSELAGESNAASFDILEARCAIDLWLT